MTATTRLLGRIALALAIVAMVGMSAHAQRGGGGRGGQGGGFGGGRGGGGFAGRGGPGLALFAMLPRSTPATFAMRSDVKEELKLTADQEEELRDVDMDRRQIMEELDIDFGSVREMEEDEIAEFGEELKGKVAKLQKKWMDDISDILSSKQTTRLKELRFQYTALTSRQPASALRAANIKVDKDDEEELQEALRDVEREIQQKIAKLRRSAYMEALSSVVSESKLESLMGESFTFDPRAGASFGSSFFGRGGGGRGPGGGQARGGGGGRPSRPGRSESGDNPRRRRPSSDDDSDDDGDSNPRRRR